MKIIAQHCLSSTDNSRQEFIEYMGNKFKGVKIKFINNSFDDEVEFEGEKSELFEALKVFYNDDVKSIEHLHPEVI